jgi:hypothetical protein
MATETKKSLPLWDPKIGGVCLKKADLRVKCPHWERANWRAITRDHLAVYCIDNVLYIYVITENDPSGAQFIVTPQMLKVLCKIPESGVAALVEAYEHKVADITAAKQEAAKPAPVAITTPPFSEKPVLISYEEVVAYPQTPEAFAAEVATLKAELADPVAIVSTADAIGARLSNQYIEQISRGIETVFVDAAAE